MLPMYTQWPVDTDVVTTVGTRGRDSHSSIITNCVPTNSSQAPSISLSSISSPPSLTRVHARLLSSVVCAERGTGRVPQLDLGSAGVQT